MDIWLEIRTSYMVARLGTISRAAQVLGISPTVVHQHIDSLESVLEANLFQRHTIGYTLTDTGQDFLESIQNADNLIEDFACKARRGKSSANEITLTVPPSLSALLLQSVTDYRRDYPHTTVNYTATDTRVKLEYGEAHVAVRGGPMPNEIDYVVQPVESSGFGLFAHTSYAQRKGLPATIDEFVNHEFVGRPRHTIRWAYDSWLYEQLTDQHFVVFADQRTTLRDAIMKGLGIGLLRNMDAEDNDELIKIQAPLPEWKSSLWLVTHVDWHDAPRVQVMLSYLKAILER